MAGWIDRLKRHKDDPEAALRMLERLNTSQAPVRMEIEGTRLAFDSSVRLRQGAVALTFPAELQHAIREGAWIRVRAPEGDKDKELRLQVSSARHGGSGMLATDTVHIIILCKIVGATLDPAKRKEDRVSTERYRDVTLKLASLPDAYRILDVSMHGARIRLANEEEFKRFPLNKHLDHGVIQLGNRAQVSIEYAIPRYVGPDSVGLELILEQEGPSRAILDAFIASLIASTAKKKADKPHSAVRLAEHEGT